MSTFTLQDLNLPTTAEDAIKTMAEMSKVNAFETPIFSITPPEMGEVLPNPTLESILKTIGEQFALLSTVINQHQGNSPNTTPPEAEENALQSTVELVLQQSAWFQEMVTEEAQDCFEEVSFEDDIKSCVETEVSEYFNYRFDPTDHFDFDEAVSQAISDRLEDVVLERMEEAVKVLFEEKMKSFNITF